MDEQPLEMECMNLDSVNETITETETTQNFTLNKDSINKIFANVCYNGSGRNVMIHGVYRVSRGIPKSIIQEKVTRKYDILREKGKVKVAVLKYDNQCKDLVALSFYDSKPVYFISMACQKIHWIKKTRKLWHKDLGKKWMFPIFD